MLGFPTLTHEQKTTLSALAVLSLVLVVTLYPWRAPTYDAQLPGFDKTYLYIDQRGTGYAQGIVAVTPNRLDMTSVPGSAPTVDIASSEVSYQAQFDALIIADSPTSTPISLAVFFPLATENVTIDFRGSDRTIQGYVIQKGRLDHSFSRQLGTYQLNQTIHMNVSITRGESITITESDGSTSATYIAGMGEVPSLLTIDRRVLQVESIGNLGSATARLENLLITIPHDQFFAPQSNDPLLPVAYAAVALLIFIVFQEQFRKLPHLFAKARRKLQAIPRRVWLLVPISFAIQLVVTPLGNHPHDMFSEKVWIYAIMTNGLASLYFRPLVTVVAQPFGGIPNQHAVFPYPPLLGYFYTAAGLPLTLLGISSTQSFAFELASKMVNILGNLVSGILVYLVAGQLTSSEKRAFLASAAYLLNPALIFDAAVWSETDSILIMFLLASVLFLFLKRPTLVWVSLALALLTKQTAIVPALVVGILSFKRNGLQSNFRGVAVGLSAALLAIGPYVIVGFSPFIMLSQTIIRLSQFALGSNTLPTSSPIAADAYSFLPLISPISGLTGRSRMWYPDVNSVPVLGLSYSLLGKILFGATALLIAYYGIRRPSLERNHFDLLLVSLLTLSSDFFPTRVSGRYFLIPLALLIPIAFASRRKSFRLSIWTLTVTTFISMYYLIAGWALAFPSAAPNLTYTLATGIVQSFFNFFDLILDIAVIANLLALLLMMELLLDWSHASVEKAFKEKLTAFLRIPRIFQRSRPS